MDFKNYYEILGLNAADRDSLSPDTIKRAYRTAALQWHPDKILAGSSERFQEINEAASVLCDPARRRTYNRKFPASQSEPQRGTKRPFSRRRDSYSWDEDFDPASDILETLAKDVFGDTWSFSNHGDDASEGFPQIQDPPVEHKLVLTLEEIASGCEKRLKITRRVFSGWGSKRHASQEENLVMISVPAGCLDGTRFTFPNKGDVRPGRISADIVFILETACHPQFVRDKADLHITVNLELKDALCGRGPRLKVPLLSCGLGGQNTGKTDQEVWLECRPDEILKPGTPRRIKGHGLPCHRLESSHSQKVQGSTLTMPSHGDLVVHFSIIFPDTITDESRRMIRQALS